MAHDVAPVKADLRNVLDVAQDAHDLLKAGLAAIRQIDLRDVAGDDHFGAEAQAREEHLHLLLRCVLRFVQNDKAVVERAAAHISERGHLDAAALHVFLVGFRAEHVKQRVIERAQVRINLLLQIARQKAQLFACLHGGAGEDDAVHLVRAEGRDGHGHGKISFAGAGRADADGDRVGRNGAAIALLAQCFRLDGLALAGDADAVAGERRQLFLAALPHKGDAVADVLLRESFPAVDEAQQAFDGPHGERHILRLAGNLQLGIPPHNGHMKFIAEQVHVLIKAAEQRGGLFHSFDVNPLLRHVFESLPKILSRLPGTGALRSAASFGKKKAGMR